MSSLDEILYYCQEDNSFGALMLTGRWGCGKTFLIEHDLPEKLGDSYIVLRVSLFGVDSLNAINKAVQKQYFEAVMKNVDEYFGLEQNGNRKLSDIFAKSKKAVSNTNGKAKMSTFILDFAKCFPGVEKFLSLEPSAYFPVETRIGTKEVILVFDDLERVNIDEIKVLGSINEYCENQHFKTIVVANEDKLRMENARSQNDEKDDNTDEELSTQRITYNEIKEKIISRTIRCLPDYEHIIGQILQAFIDKDGEYKKFILMYTEDIVKVFIEGKSENIRSLRCALQDFQRVYVIFKQNGFTHDLEKYLLAFIAYVLCFKEGKIKKHAVYGSIFSDSEVETCYPIYFKSSYILSSIKEWIIEGIWDEKVVLEEINRKLKALKGLTPAEQVQDSYLIMLDEEVISKGFPKVIDLAYEGALTLNEYILLIQNISWTRTIPYDLPMEVNMDLLKKGVEVQLKKVSESDKPETRVYHGISVENLKDLSKEENDIYKMISNFRENQIQMFEINKRKYLTILSSKNMNGLYECENKRFNVFDNEMAIAITSFYKELPNANRQTFNALFKKMWMFGNNSPDLQKAASIPGFEALKQSILQLKEEEMVAGLKLKAALCQSLVSIVEITIQNLQSSIPKEVRQ